MDNLAAGVTGRSISSYFHGSLCDLVTLGMSKVTYECWRVGWTESFPSSDRRMSFSP